MFAQALKLQGVGKCRERLPPPTGSHIKKPLTQYIQPCKGDVWRRDFKSESWVKTLTYPVSEFDSQAVVENTYSGADDTHCYIASGWRHLFQLYQPDSVSVAGILFREGLTLAISK